MRILAIDPSLTSTGFAIGSKDDPNPWKWPAKRDDHLGTLTNSLKGMDRLAWIRHRVIELMDGCDIVVIEGYSYASRGSAVISLGELGGVLRLTLHDLHAPYVEVSPGAMKKYATGSGNSKKELVLVEAVKRLEYNGASSDEADALWLLEMALDHYGIVKPVVPKSHCVKLNEPAWPTL